MTGAIAKYISVGMIIEEGFLLKDLQEIVKTMRKAADEAGVYIVTGDTKVVNKGCADGIFINTAGVGERIAGVDISPLKSKSRTKYYCKWVFGRSFCNNNGLST